MNNDDRSSALFLQLVLMFQAAAMQHMGKIKNPVTDKIEQDLEQAQIAIDMLAMIEEKTKGNLSDDEKRLIDGVLQNLRINYVDEISKSQQERPNQ